MAPKRILFPYAGDTILGGSHISSLSLAKSLDTERFEPRVVVHFQEGEVGLYARSLGLDVEVIPDVPLLGASRLQRRNDVGIGRYAGSTFPALLRLLKRHEPDIVHTNEGRIHNNWTMPVLFSRRKHLWHHRQDPKAFGINKLAPFFADCIVSVSDFSKPAAPAKSIDSKFHVVRSPFDFPHPVPNKVEERQKICDELGLPRESVILGYFGALNERKRPVHFVEAIAAIQASFTDRPVHGLIFGAVEVTDQRLDLVSQERAVALGISDNIHMMGHRSPVAGFMAGVDVMLVTALNEPFGRTLIEAMYLGTPVVATRHGGNVEAILDGQTGFLLDHEDPRAFVEPIRKLLQKPELRDQICTAGHIEAITNYGLDRHVRAISEIYDLLVPTGR